MARASGELAAEFEATVVAEDPAPVSYNIAPTTRIPVVIDTTKDGETTRRLEAAKWGLVPRWAKDESVAVRAFNARSETAAVKPTFREAVRKRRAIIPADGYYEWQKLADGTKQPHYIHPTDGSLLLFAGLYEWWRRADNSWLLSATVLTRPATAGKMAELHDRIPVFVDRGEVDAWLSPETVGDADFIATYAERGAAISPHLEVYPVDRRVGNVRINEPSLTARI